MNPDLHTALVGLLIAVIAYLTKVIKDQTQNGDGRTLRKAVDDLAESFHDHRSEYRTDTKDTRERLGRLEDSVFSGTVSQDRAAN